MKVVLAQESDSERLKSYFSQHKVEGAFDYVLERPGSFFDPYRLYSEDSATFMLQHHDEIEGVATLVFRKMILNGQEKTIGYARDLRVSPTRNAIVQWAHLFFAAFDEACRLRGCEFIFSAVERYETQAYNALIRPQRTRRKLPRYYLYWKMFFIGIHGLWPGLSRKVVGVHIAPGSIGDVEELVHYMQSKQEGRLLYTPWTSERLLGQLARWPGFKVEDFLVARDHKRNIIGCLSLWNPKQVQNIRVTAYHGRSSVLQQTLGLGRFIGLTHRLSDVGETLNYRSVGHLCFDNPDVFETLLIEAWNRILPGEFLSYACYKGDYSARPPHFFISSQIPYGFYSVLPPDRTLPDFLRPNPWTPPPEFDLSALL